MVRPDTAFLRKVLIVAVLAGFALVLVKVVQVLLLAFGAVLVSIILRVVAEPIEKRTPLGQNGSLAVAVLLVAGAVGLTIWFFGSEAERQFASLSITLPGAWADLREELSRSPLGARILAELRSLDGRTGWLLSWGPRLASGLASAVASLVIVLFAGLFLAFRPRYYLSGVLRLAPLQARRRVEEVLLGCGAALRQWLVSQTGSMVLVGVCVGVALSLAGVRSPLALGVLAGLGQFVPVLGPFVVAAPGVLLALTDSPEKGLWTVLIYIGIGQFESNLFTPLMLRQMAKLPMAMSLFAVLAFGILLGPLGALLATPLTVVIYVLVKMVYVEDMLGDRTDLELRPSSSQRRSARPRKKALSP